MTIDRNVRIFRCSLMPKTRLPYDLFFLEYLIDCWLSQYLFLSPFIKTSFIWFWISIILVIMCTTFKDRTLNSLFSFFFLLRNVYFDTMYDFYFFKKFCSLSSDINTHSFYFYIIRCIRIRCPITLPFKDKNKLLNMGIIFHFECFIVCQENINNWLCYILKDFHFKIMRMLLPEEIRLTCVPFFQTKIESRNLPIANCNVILYV